MASLWNYVTRLTSRRHWASQQSLPAPDAGSGQDAETARAAKAVADHALTLSQPPLAGVIAEDRVEPAAAIELPAAIVAEQATDAAYPAVIAAHIADGDSVAAPPESQAVPPASRARAPRRQNNRAETAAAGRNRANPPAVTPQAISLDDEIKVLRRALIGKLKLQNAQLKAMLERFKR